MHREFGHSPSILHEYIRQLRDQSAQHNKRNFALNIRRISMAAGIEISRELSYRTTSTTTPIGTAATQELADQIVIVSILRAGLPVQDGLVQIFNQAELGFVTAHRTEHREPNGFVIDLSYIATPALTGKTLIIADTMVATGKSVAATYQAITESGGQPQSAYLACVIASKQAVMFLEQTLPNLRVFVCQIDPRLTPDFLIDPGLGDAGDILYGKKAL